jgi:hypothetical protein
MGKKRCAERKPDKEIDIATLTGFLLLQNVRCGLACMSGKAELHAILMFKSVYPE